MDCDIAIAGGGPAGLAAAAAIIRALPELRVKVLGHPHAPMSGLQTQPVHTLGLMHASRDLSCGVLQTMSSTDLNNYKCRFSRLPRSTGLRVQAFWSILMARMRWKP